MKLSGTPITGSVSLTNGAPGPVAIALQMTSNGAAYTLGTNEVVVITSISVSSNDTAQPLITIDDGATAGAYTSRILAKYYTGATLPAVTPSFPPGTVVGRTAVNLRATASAVTAAKTVEVVISGYVTVSR